MQKCGATFGIHLVLMPNVTPETLPICILYKLKSGCCHIRPVSSLFHTSSHGGHSNKCICEWWLAGFGCPDDRHLGSRLIRGHIFSSTRRITKHQQARRHKDQRAGVARNRRLPNSKDPARWKATCCIIKVGTDVPWRWGGPGSAAAFGAEPAWHRPGAETGRGRTAPPGTASRSRWRRNCWKLLLGAPRTGPALGRHPSHRTAPCPERTGGEKSNFPSHFSRWRGSRVQITGFQVYKKNQTFSLVSDVPEIKQIFCYSTVAVSGISCWVGCYLNEIKHVFVPGSPKWRLGVKLIFQNKSRIHLQITVMMQIKP